jgi:hypothetical protein
MIMADKPDDGFADVDVIYMGKRRLSDGRDGIAFITFDQYEALAAAGAHATLEYASSVFGIPKGLTYMGVGGVYTTPCVIDTTAAGGQIKRIRLGQIVGTSSGAKVLPEHASLFFLADQATRDRTKAENVQKRVAENNSVSEAMRALSWVYRQLPANQRNGFKLWMLGKLDERG